MKDYIVKAVTKDGNIRMYCATTKNLVNEAQKLHNTSALASAALGRVLTATALMSSMLKGKKESVSIQFKGDGPLGTVLAVGKSDLSVKGQVDNPYVELPLNYAGKLDVGAGIGYGTVTVIRDLELKKPYIGQIPINTGEIGDDLTYYFYKSEQTPSSVGLGVLVDTDYSIKAAGGFIIQLLPSVVEEDIDNLEKALKNVKSITDLFEKGMTPEDIIRMILCDFDVEILETVEPVYKCDCSRGRMERALITLGEKEIQDMINEDIGAELVCHFCEQKYQFTKEELERIKLLSSIK